METDGVLWLPVDGQPLTPALARDAIGEALGSGAAVVVVPVGRLDATFLDLSTGVAGDVVQAFVNYRIRLVVFGELPRVALDSRSLAAFVREANRGTQIWFLATEEELAGRLAAGT
jgi:hypothetical protein